MGAVFFLSSLNDVCSESSNSKKAFVTFREEKALEIALLLSVIILLCIFLMWSLFIDFNELHLCSLVFLVYAVYDACYEISNVYLLVGCHYFGLC